MSPTGSLADVRIVAIDGAGGSGKSTLARRLARELGMAYLNTGLMYRSLARRALDRGVDPSDSAGLVDLAGGLRFSLAGEAPPRLHLDGEVPGAELASSDVEEIVSEVSGHADVRSAMVEEQRGLAKGGGVIEGRDIGSVVFPQAEVKIFLDASPQVRASRRAAERRENGDDASADALARRNERDARTVPHEPTPDALVIDTTNLQPPEVLAQALHAIREAWAENTENDPVPRDTALDPRAEGEQR